MAYTIKDSGKMSQNASGMRRDAREGKTRYDLIPTFLLKRLADHLAKGAEKYGAWNWMQANTQQELDGYKESGLRHFIQWRDGEDDEDHMAAVVFNMMCAENVKDKIIQGLIDVSVAPFPEVDAPEEPEECEYTKAEGWCCHRSSCEICRSGCKLL
jgi:hypothetical protein